MYLTHMVENTDIYEILDKKYFYVYARHAILQISKNCIYWLFKYFLQNPCPTPSNKIK